MVIRFFGPCRIVILNFQPPWSPWTWTVEFLTHTLYSSKLGRTHWITDQIVKDSYHISVFKLVSVPPPYRSAITCTSWVSTTCKTNRGNRAQFCNKLLLNILYYVVDVALWLHFNDQHLGKNLFLMCNSLNTLNYTQHKVEYWISNSHRSSIEQGTARGQ